MSEISEKATEIWKRRYEEIKHNREVRDCQTKKYINLILDVFGASNEEEGVPCGVAANDQKLKCFVQIDKEGCGEVKEYQFLSTIANKRVMEAMNNVNECEATEDTVTRIYDFLLSDTEVVKYFEVTLTQNKELRIKMRVEIATCKNEEPKE